MRIYKEVMGKDNLPWEYDAEAGCIDGRLRYVCDTGKKCATVVLMNEDDAALAVHCVNNHERLVEALRDMVELDDCSSPRMYIAAKDNAMELLAQLQAGKGGEG